MNNKASGNQQGQGNSLKNGYGPKNNRSVGQGMQGQRNANKRKAQGGRGGR